MIAKGCVCFKHPNTPAMGGVEARGDDVPDRGPVLISILWSLTALAGIMTLLRVVVRTRNRMFGWDDIFMIFAMVCYATPYSSGVTFYKC